MKSQLQTLGVSLSSAIVGALFISWLQAPKHVSPRAETSAPPIAAPRIETRVLSTVSDPQLARRLSAVEQQLADRAAQQPKVADGEPPFDPAEAEAREAEHQAAREATFSAQPVDRGWAPDAARSFQTELGTFEGATFKSAPVDCRTTVCRTQLTWGSYEAARAEAKNVVQHGYATNCAKEILTPTPEGDPKSPYTATLYFDCSNLRNASAPK